MRTVHRRQFAIVAGTLCCLVLIGCQSEVPAGKASATIPAAGTTSESAAVTSDSPFELESDFVALSLDQFESFGTEPETWKATPNGIACTGKPRGYLYSKQPYQNFTLRVEYIFTRPENLKDEAKFKGNTGFLIYITGEHKLWPMCLEVQGKHVQMAAIKENGGAQPVMVDDDDAARQKARNAVGQWNTLEIVSKSGELTASINGTPISKSQPDFLSEGPIGIQSEDHPFEVRRMRIRAE